MTATRRSKASPYPQHEYAAEHKVLIAKEQVTSKRRLRDVADLQPIAEVACERIREFAWDVGAELRAEKPDGWMAATVRDYLGIHYEVGRRIVNGEATAISPRTIDAIARFSGVPVKVFCDPEE